MSTQRYCFRLGALVFAEYSALALGLLLSLHAAEPIKIFDQEIVIRGQGGSWPCAPNLPSNWTSPVDYSKGVLYIDWEILDAAETCKDLILQIGWTFPDGKYQLVRFKYQSLLRSTFKDRVDAKDLPAELKEPYFIAGTYRTVHVLNSGRFFWPLPEKDPRDFSKGISGIRAMVRNREWQVVGTPAPVRMKVTMIVVPSGGKLGSSPVAESALSPLDPSIIKHLSEVRTALQQRNHALALRLAQQARLQPAPAGDEAQTVTAALEKYYATRLETLAARKLKDSVSAVEELQALHKECTGTSLEASFKSQLDLWMREDTYRRELPAHRLYTAIEQEARMLRERLGGGSLKDPRNRQTHVGSVQRLAEIWRSLERYPQSAAHRKAQTLLTELELLEAPKQ